MSKVYSNKISNFKTISLTELNAKASYLKRIDRKYLVNWTQFVDVLKELKKDFKVLEIKWQKVFSYDNVYMDTDDYLFYNQHQNKQKSRTKIRTRYYVDSDLAFFEYKQKNNWVTSKYRYDFPSEEHWFMTKWKKRFFDWIWQSTYEQDKAPKITPSIKTRYKRITLVNKTGGERLTIDFDIKTNDLRDKKSKEVNLKNLVIIESKSLSNDCHSCKIMKKHWINKAKSCSKYSLWVIYSWLAKKYDTFKETMEKIKIIRLDTLQNRSRKPNLTISKEINKQFTTKKLSVK
jgi:hypothetical protein